MIESVKNQIAQCITGLIRKRNHINKSVDILKSLCYNNFKFVSEKTKKVPIIYGENYFPFLYKSRAYMYGHKKFLKYLTMKLVSI